MSSSDYVYVIPPYLLNTCFGLELQKALYWVDPELAYSNQFQPSSSGYHLRSPQDLSYPVNSFSNDAEIDEIIKKKLTQKFSVMGVLGNSPPKSIPDSYLFELYDIFQTRLNAEAAESAEENLAAAEHVERFLANLSSSSFSQSTGPARGPHASMWGYPQSSGLPNKSSAKSVFDIKNYGEFMFHNLTSSDKSKVLENLPLDALFAWTKKMREHKYFYSPYLMHDRSYSYLFRLPMYWCPLSAGKDLLLLEKRLGLEQSFEEGLSVVRLKLQEKSADLDLSSRKKRFFNFISNTEIPSLAGVFYYEVTIEQTASAGSQFRPIIYANDSSISSGSSLLFNMGFSKRFIKFDKIPSATSSSSTNSSNIDLKSLLHKLSQNESMTAESTIDDETLTFLGAEPGVSLEGSLAISFNNSCSYASTKTGDSPYRSSSLNLNRRISQLNRHNNDQENSKLDIDAPFSIHSKAGASGKKFFKSDVVGFGVNFTSKSLFITLNGILVKSITDDEIVSSNKYKDSIFDTSEDTISLFPMIGFQVSDNLGDVQEGESPESKIATNFGLKPFVFNIDGYVKSLKDEQRNILQQMVSEEIGSISSKDTVSNGSKEKNFEMSVCNINNSPNVLNDLIKGYLVQEVLMESHEALNADFLELQNNTKAEMSSAVNESSLVGDDTSIVQLSFANDRQRLKQLILNHDFRQAIDLIDHKFDFLPDKENFKFELELSNFIRLIRDYLETNYRDEKTNVDAEIFQCSKRLLSKTQSDANISSLIGELSGVLLLSNREEISDLPEAKGMIENFDVDTELLADHLNRAISKSLGFRNESKLQTMVSKVGENIQRLSSIEEPFKLVNYEKDFIEL